VVQPGTWRQQRKRLAKHQQGYITARCLSFSISMVSGIYWSTLFTWSKNLSNLSGLQDLIINVPLMWQNQKKHLWNLWTTCSNVSSLNCSIHKSLFTGESSNTTVSHQPTHRPDHQTWNLKRSKHHRIQPGRCPQNVTIQNARPS
jgi:hypothetical protein